MIKNNLKSRIEDKKETLQIADHQENIYNLDMYFTQ